MNKYDPEKVYQQIIDGCILERIDNRPKGGQSCGIMRLPWKISHPEYAITIICGERRTDHDNKELCKTLFSLAINDCLKF